jgi:hypothetical protein
VARRRLTDVAASAAVKGLGGVGKSVLAQEYAWRNRGRYHGVWWIRAEKSETLLDDLVELGARFIPGIREVPDRAQAAHAALDHIAQMRAGKPWLLVYDNVEQPGDIARLTPTGGAHVLITTRWPDWHGHAVELPVDVFSPPLAVAFLLAHAPKPDADAAARLAADLGFLPLALAHARAEPPMRRALAILETSLGPDHPNTKTVRGNLAGLEAEPRAAAAGSAASSDARLRPESDEAPQPSATAADAMARRGWLPRWLGGA